MDLATVLDEQSREVPRCPARHPNDPGVRCDRRADHPARAHRGTVTDPRTGAGAVIEWSTAPLFAVGPKARHRFPHRRITLKVMTATRRRPWCDRGHFANAAPGHYPVIPIGEQYLRVSLRPDKGGGSGGWRSRHLCRACALDYGLVTEGES